MDSIINVGDTIAVKAKYGGSWRFRKVARVTATQAILDDNGTKIRRDGEDGQREIGPYKADGSTYYRMSDKIRAEDEWHKVAQYAKEFRLVPSNGRGDFSHPNQTVEQVVAIHKEAMAKIWEIVKGVGNG